jgi:putative transposase
VLKEREAGRIRPTRLRACISEATIYNWTAKFNGMDVSEAERLMTLEEQNAGLGCFWLNRCSMRLSFEPLSKKW